MIITLDCRWVMVKERLIKGRGKIMIISMSKIKKIIAILKNRREKGERVIK